MRQSYEGSEYYNLKDKVCFDLIGHDYAIVKLNRNIAHFKPPRLLQDYNPQSIANKNLNKITIYGYS